MWNTRSEKNSGDAGAMRKLEEDMDNLKVETVNKSISKVIREQRTKLGLKQKDLKLAKVNVTPTVIQQYENGSIKSDIKVLLKLERVLKCKLTGKGFYQIKFFFFLFFDLSTYRW